MLDIIGSTFASSLYAVVVAGLVGFADLRAPGKAAVVVVAALWAVLVVAVAAAGGFAPGAMGPFPATGIAFIVFIAVLFGAWFISSQFRHALLSVPLPVLTALNIGRI